MKAQCVLLAVMALVVGCGEKVPSDASQGSTTPPYVRAEPESPLSETVVPVRIGELGPNFAACNARGTTRDRASAGAVPVRSAPFEAADVIDRLAPASEFFICSRTHDQRWFGIVYDEGGRATDRCGVTGPVPERRTYRGPCAAGWVPSVLIRLVSGVPHQLEEDVVSAPPDG